MKCSLTKFDNCEECFDNEDCDIWKAFQKASKRNREPSEEFDRFWSAYPRKVDKPAAKRAWRAIKGKLDINAVVVAIENHKKMKQWTDGAGFIPHPATWINGRRWEDEVSTGKTTDLGGVWYKCADCGKAMPWTMGFTRQCGCGGEMQKIR